MGSTLGRSVGFERALTRDYWSCGSSSGESESVLFHCLVWQTPTRTWCADSRAIFTCWEEKKKFNCILCCVLFSLVRVLARYASHLPRNQSRGNLACLGKSR